MSEWCERMSKQASGLVLTSRFLAVLNLCEVMVFGVGAMVCDVWWSVVWVRLSAAWVLVGDCGMRWVR